MLSLLPIKQAVFYCSPTVWRPWLRKKQESGQDRCSKAGEILCPSSQGDFFLPPLHPSSHRRPGCKFCGLGGSSMHKGSHTSSVRLQLTTAWDWLHYSLKYVMNEPGQEPLPRKSWVLEGSLLPLFYLMVMPSNCPPDIMLMTTEWCRAQSSSENLLISAESNWWRNVTDGGYQRTLRKRKT